MPPTKKREPKSLRPSAKTRFALVGFGHWGPNHARLIAQHPRCELVLCVEHDAERLSEARRLYPHLHTYNNLSEALAAHAHNTQHIDAVIIATPTSTHAPLVEQALAAGCHVLCEKPLSLSASECLQLQAQAKRQGKVLMVDHTFLFNGGIQALKAQCEQLGQLYYLTSTRTNLGPIRQDVGALADLATHDIAVFNWLLGAMPRQVSACGHRFLPHAHEDVVFASLWYDHGVVAHLHCSWLNPVKVRQMTVVGSQHMLTWDDMHPQEPLRVYEASVQPEPYYADFGQFKLLPQRGAVHIPAFAQTEPLSEVLHQFLAAIHEGTPTGSDGHFAAGVAQTLSALQTSMAQQGAPVQVTDLTRP